MLNCRHHLKSLWGINMKYIKFALEQVVIPILFALCLVLLFVSPFLLQSLRKSLAIAFDLPIIYYLYEIYCRKANSDYEKWEENKKCKNG